MKQKLFILIALPLVLAATGCGKSNDAAVNTNAVAAAPAAATPTCPANQAWNGSQCVTTQYGQPPGYNNGYPGNGYPGQQVNCPYYGGGYQSMCGSGGYQYRWYYYYGRYYYFY